MLLHDQVRHLRAGLDRAVENHMMNLLETFITEHHPDHEKELNDNAVDMFKAGLLHLAGIYDIASGAIDEMEK